MAEYINRQQLVDMLERLGSDDDADILAAAKEAHAMVSGAGMTWDVVLVPESVDEPVVPDDIDDSDDMYDDDIDDIDDTEESVEDLEDDVDDAREDADEAGDDVDDADDDDDEVDRKSGATDDSESLKLIERMMVHAKDNDDFREELNGYKEDIAEGEFTDRDRKYLRDLHARLRAK